MDQATAIAVSLGSSFVLAASLLVLYSLRRWKTRQSWGIKIRYKRRKIQSTRTNENGARLTYPNFVLQVSFQLYTEVVWSQTLKLLTVLAKTLFSQTANVHFRTGAIFRKNRTAYVERGLRNSKYRFGDAISLNIALISENRDGKLISHVSLCRPSGGQIYLYEKSPANHKSNRLQCKRTKNINIHDRRLPV